MIRRGIRWSETAKSNIAGNDRNNYDQPLGILFTMGRAHTRFDEEV